MDRRDKRLLDKQLWGVDPRPPSLIGLAFAAAFVGGMLIGSIFFAREYKQTHAISTDVTGSISPPKPGVRIPD
jgi:hypothetical protein